MLASAILELCYVGYSQTALLEHAEILHTNCLHALASTAVTHRHRQFPHLKVEQGRSPAHPLQPLLALQDGGSHTWREETSLVQTSGDPKLSVTSAPMPATRQ